MYVRIGNAVGSMVQLVGAFAIGSALHQSLVEGTVAVTAPPSVAWIVLGLVLIGVGRGLERRYGSDPRSDDEEDPERDTQGGYDEGGYDERSGERNDRGSDEGKFDERWAPFDATDLEKYERDDDYDATRSKRR